MLVHMQQICQRWYQHHATANTQQPNEHTNGKPKQKDDGGHR